MKFEEHARHNTGDNLGRLDQKRPKSTRGATMHDKSLPPGWNRLRLEKLSSIQTGISKNQNIKTETVELPYLRVANVQNGYLDLSEIKTLQVPVEKVERYKLRRGDVLMTEGGDFDKLGRGTVWNGQIEPCLHQNHIFVVRPDTATLTPEFLSALTGSPYGRKYFVSCAKQSTNLASINSTQLKAFPVLLPPLPEQKAIADLLSIWDEAIETVEQLIRAKESHLDSCGRRLFGIHHNDKRTGWNVVKLETVLVEHGRKSSGCEDVFSVSVHKGLVNQIEHLGRCFSAANTTGYHRVQHGDIVYTKSPTGNYPLGIVKQSHVTEDVIVSPLYGVFSPITFSLGTVLDFYFSSPTRASNYLLPLVQKGAKNTIAISNTTFLSGSLSLPVEEEAQNNIAEFVLTAREEIDRLRLLEEKYKTQKRGLMQKLLTGEWRVSQEMLTNSVKLNPDQGMEASCR